MKNSTTTSRWLFVITALGQFPFALYALLNFYTFDIVCFKKKIIVFMYVCDLLLHCIILSPFKVDQG